MKEKGRLLVKTLSIIGDIITIIVFAYNLIELLP